MHPDEPAVETKFSSAWALDASDLEPDPASWRDEPESIANDGDPAWLEFDIPTADPEPSTSMQQWNLGTEPRSTIRQTLAFAAAFVPLMLGGELVRAAPPPAETVAPTIESPPPPDDRSAIWAALQDRLVILTRNDGATFRGTVLSVNDDALVCARDGDGLVLLVPIPEIAFVQVLDAEEERKKKAQKPGQGMIVLGTIATVVGGSLTIAAAAIGATCASNSYYGDIYVCPYLTAPLGAVGLANLAAGIPLLAVGVRKRNAARAAAGQQPTMSAFLAPGREGVMAGFGMRF